MSDKKISELPVASAINAGDISVLVDSGTDYQYSFTQFLQFLETNLVIGAKITFGTVLPQNTAGNNGDVFVNTLAGSFAQKITGAWAVVYTLPAANAADGTLLYGAGTPSSANGKNADSFINTLTGIFYYKTAGVWSQVFSMATGPQGPQGSAGTNGANGTNGNTILYGSGLPSNSTTGVNGDFYINTSTFTLFGPKASGVWPAGTSLIGGNGPTGPTGAAGPGVPTGGTANQVLAKIDATNYNTQWVNQSGGLTAANFVFGEVPAGAVNGSNSTFNTANTATSGTERIYQNGLRLKATADYSITGTTITLVTAPLTGDTLLTDYLK